MSDKVSTEVKQSAPGDNADSKKSDSHHSGASSGHEVTGAEKFTSSGGSGGITIRGGQGYEHLADH